MTADVLIVGGGVIGLSLAYELARRGVKACVLERGRLGHESSWAGAGILPAGNLETAREPWDRLAGLSFVLHSKWAEQLRSETQLDTGFRRCGGIYLAQTPAARDELEGQVQEWVSRRIECIGLNANELLQIEPECSSGGPFNGGTVWLVPREAQLRNPWHLRALEAACRRLGVTVCEQHEVVGLDATRDRITGVRTATGTFSGGSYCIAGGAWSGELLNSLGVALPVRPVRGQIVLLKHPHLRLSRVINSGPRYLVPRGDGRVLVGSTEEEVGFDRRTTSLAVGQLIEFALGLVPALADAEVERTWAGLRPASADGLPYLGRIPGYQNGFVAAGHFRNGLYLSCATAELMSDLILGKEPVLDLSPFGVLRGSPASHV